MERVFEGEQAVDFMRENQCFCWCIRVHCMVEVCFWKPDRKRKIMRNKGKIRTVVLDGTKNHC